MPVPKFLQKFLCCKSCKGDGANIEGGGDMINSAKDAVSGSWADEMLQNTLLKQGIVKCAVIASFPGGDIRAKNFEISEQGLKDVIKALEGDTSAIAESGIVLGGGLPVYNPGKTKEGTFILGTAVAGEEGATGGCAIYKTLSHVIIATFEKDLEGASGFVGKIAGGLMEKGM